MKNVEAVELFYAERNFPDGFSEGIRSGIIIGAKYWIEDMGKERAPSVFGVEDSDRGNGAWEGGVDVKLN